MKKYMLLGLGFLYILPAQAADIGADYTAF